MADDEYTRDPPFTIKPEYEPEFNDPEPDTVSVPAEIVVVPL